MLRMLQKLFINNDFEKLEMGSLNIGTGKCTTMEQIANVIGGKVKFIPKRSFEVEAHQADMDNCYNLIDWKHEVEVLEWLKEFVRENENN